MDIEKLLTHDQKTEIIKARLKMLDTGGPFELVHDRRYAWDFEVRRHPVVPRVVFSVSIVSERFEFAMTECARALRDIRRSTADATRRKVTGDALYLPKGTIMLRGPLSPLES